MMVLRGMIGRFFYCQNKKEAATDVCNLQQLLTIDKWLYHIK
ncbi:hypothetical protein [Coprococcus eutactus]|nr:hypothetical protein [Coprococcus eutactus]EDP24931.1 hypothetical protein COPEUT_02869 [Coprococcus eutactus ATCC 27759]UWP17897.1 hypothetical protein NQ536_04435 [Coprococcus eutactus]